MADTTDVVRRPRLFARLDAAPARLVWIHGAAGSGKTTLVASHLARHLRVPALWYRCDGRDADPATFFAGFSSALEDAFPRAAPAPAFLAADAATLGYFARGYFEHVFASLPEAVVTVLDDAHETRASPSWDLLWPAIGEVIPARSRLVVVSRDPPPECLVRMQVHGDLEVIAPSELAFSLDEVAELVASRSRDREPDAEVVRQLHARTEGWVAALRLLLARGVATASPPGHPVEPLHAYFRREVLARLSPEERSLLVATAPLEELDPILVARITGDERAAEHLEHLVRAGTPIERSASPPPRFRAHALLREVLLGERAKHGSSETLAAEAERIASLLAEAGQVEDAIEVSIAHGTSELATDRLPSIGRRLLEQGRALHLLEWLGRIDEARVVRAPALVHLRGRARAMTYDPGCLADLEHAVEAHAQGARGDLALQALCDWVTAAALLLFDIAPLERAIAAGAALVQRFGVPADETLAFRYDLALFTALHFAAPEDGRLEGLAARIAASGGARDAGLCAEAACELAIFHIMAARPADARHALDALLTSEDALAPAVRAMTRYMRVYLSWALGDRAALSSARASWDALIEETGLVGFRPLQAFVATIDRLCRGSPDRALEAPTDPPADAGPGISPLMRVFSAIVSCWVEIAANRTIEAEAWRQVAARAHGAVALDVNEALIGLAGAMIAARERRLSAAAELCTFARRRFAAARVHLHELSARYLEAWLRLAGGDRSGVAPAFAFARERGIVNVWLLPQDLVAELCGAALAEGVEEPFVRKVIAARELVPPGALAALPEWPARLRVRCLGPFELFREDVPIATGRTLGRPLELLLAIIAFGGRAVPISRLEEALWPDADGDAAHNSFKVALHRLRALVGVDEAIVLAHQSVSLDPRLVWVDVEALEHLGATLGEREPVQARSLLARLHRGAFAAGCADQAWVLEPRRRWAALAARIERAVSEA